MLIYRAKQRATLDHYEGMFGDYSIVYERSQLAEQLRALKVTEENAREKLQTAEQEGEDIRQKIQAFKADGGALSLD